MVGKKFIVIVGDGMADYPLEGLGGKTPLQAAQKPNIDFIASEGKIGMIRTIPEGMSPGSAVANLAILGYDPRKYFTGRGPLEAGAMGIELGHNDVAFRCNLITEKDGKMIDYSAGHVTTEEAVKLLGEVRKLKSGELHAGMTYRHIFLLRGNDANVGCAPPHDIVGEQISTNLIPSKDETSRKLNELMLSSRKVLSEHPVNKNRVKLGKNPANMIWLWGPGRRPSLELFEKKYGLNGAMISAVTLIRGLGVYTGMQIIDVPGATGYYDTNYEGKADSAIKALDKNDFVYVHVEAPDEAGHAGDVEQKIKSIEDLDGRLVGRILNRAEGCTVAILPDHSTPINVGTHVSDPVPFAIYAAGIKGDGLKFDEASAEKGSLGFIEGEKFIELLLRQWE